MIKNCFKLICKYLVLFLIGGIFYVCLELLWRGRSDITSFFMGGIALLVVGQLNEGYDYNMPIWYQMIISGTFITSMEYIVGKIFNSDYHIWDYRGMWLNIDGQVCLVYFLLWCLLSLMGIMLDDLIRWKFFGEDKPKYRWI